MPSWRSMRQIGCPVKINLKRRGFALTEGDAGIPTCFTGTFSYGTGKPVMGILGEYDALSSLSQKAADPHKEPLTEGAPGHGCGHCALGTVRSQQRSL